MKLPISIISTETIKPSSSTPYHLKTYKLSLIDQSNLDHYYPLLLFYSRVDKDTIQISNHLKKSLSETLIHYYPFAGRVKDDYCIDCDDSGVTFIEAHVFNDMSEVLKKPEIGMLEQLLPYNPNEKVISTQANLAVQLNYFDCGGVAICLCFRHVVADVTAGTYFVNNWANVACGSSDIKDVIFDFTSLFPPHNLMRSISRSIDEKHCAQEFVVKRFVFDGTNIAGLRKKVNDGSCNLDSPTRFEVVSAVIWGALIATARETNESTPLAAIPVNLRKRMNPPLPPQCIGNVIHPVTASWFADTEIDYSCLARRIRESIKKLSDDDVRKVYEGDAFVNQIKAIAEELVNSTATKVGIFGFSGWGGLPYYETDFGWGKPKWVSTALRSNDLAILLDTSDGKGIETWVALPKNDMPKFEQYPDILTYASLNTSL